MKSIGIVRQVDKMGRVVIPKEMRAQLKIKNNVDSFEISMEGEKIVLKKFHPTCLFCDSLTEVVTFGDHIICKSCIEKLNSMLENAE
ncbi:MAG: AbrB/MazE/SpoVT family DNA-binding domain-containing protein [Clostridia bacterium]|nr:AbrB/MazE/SpoVT family DNA-binding domain-containing protein [Clostridia bacterium]